MGLDESTLVPAYHPKVQKIIERVDGVNPETDQSVEVHGGALLKLYDQFYTENDYNKKNILAETIESACDRMIYDINHLSMDGFLRKDHKALDAAEAKVKEIMSNVRGVPTSDIAGTNEIEPVGCTICKGVAA